MKIAPVFNVTDDMITEDDNLLSFAISRAEVETGNYGRINKLLILLNKHKKLSHNKISLSFMYDDDPREIYEIEEICSYMRNIFEKCPHFYYFMTMDRISNTVLLYCIIGVTIVARTQFGCRVLPKSEERSSEIIRKVIRSTKAYSNEIGDIEGAVRVLRSMQLV